MTDEERKQKKNEYTRRYRETHPEVVEKNRQKSKEYYWSHHDKMLDYARQYAKDHREKLKSYYREYHKKHDEERNKYSHDYYIKHREEILEMHKRNKKSEITHGCWLGTADGYADGELVYDMWNCSQCGFDADGAEDKPEWLYCPHCGAKMDLEVEE